MLTAVYQRFRWAQCQLDALESCVDLPMLRRTLKQLPEDLDETYARILRGIKPELRTRAVTILRWLLFSARPLRIEEVVDVVAVKSNPEFQFDPENRLPEPRDIIEICSSLVTTVTAVHDIAGVGDIEVEELTLAHFSVKEYLISDRVYNEIEDFDFQEMPSNKEITEICLEYLFYLVKPEAFTTERLNEFPLARYSARFWMQHARAIDNEEMVLLQKVLKLLSSQEDFYFNWCRLYDTDFPWKDPVGEIDYVPTNRTPLYHASSEGIYWLVKELIENGADINAKGGEYGHALQAAAYSGHLDIVTLLLKKGADINAEGGIYGHAFQAAAYSGHLDIVTHLLEKGANINANSGYYGHALQAAAYIGHLHIVTHLLEKGANINAKGGIYGHALQAAAYSGHLDIFILLLETGANINTKGGYYGHALQAAAVSGHLDIVTLLLEKGANINAEGGIYGHTLQAAACFGHLDIVKLLLEKGANINAKGGIYGHALQAAAYSGHLDIVTLLLKKGADINAKGGEYGHALQAAAYSGHLDIITYLLEKGADINAEGGEYGHVLQAALAGEDLDIIALLLENGADINTQGGDFYNKARQAALEDGRQDIVTLLLEYKQ